ncbi:MAG: hypothetical protein ABJM29_06805 [Rhizobiaceae bacterium]
MTSTAPLTDYIQASLPLAIDPLQAKPARSWQRMHGTGGALPTPRMIKSVVDEAGLGRFVYLQGNSGRRYVFSSIRREQASLYDHALFAAAVSDADGKQNVRIVSSVQEISDACGAIYVHLLDEEDEHGSVTLDELCGENSFST